MARVRLLLPARERFAGQRLPEAAARALGRADRGRRERPQLEDAFDVLPRGWPAAAVTRQRDARDAAGARWLRGDPAYVQPDINGARLLAYGPALRLDAADRDAFLPALRPLFGDAGAPLDAPVPDRWYLRLPEGAKLPRFTPIDEALGADLFEHIPAGGDVESRRWRTLLSEAQVVLHNHPHNAARAARGLPPVNSLWFWGAGALPDSLRTPFGAVWTRDDTLAAFAALAGATVADAPRADAADAAAVLVDLRDARGIDEVAKRWLEPLARSGASLELDFADGVRFVVGPRQRWRFWRRPLATLDA